MTNAKKARFPSPVAPPTPLLLHPKRIMKGCSFKIICKKNKLNQAGFAPLALQFFISGAKGELGLSLSIPPELWNEKRQQMDNPKNIKDYENYNLLIEQHRSDFNKVLIDMALQNIEPTKELIKSRLENKGSREDFAQFFDQLYQDRYNKRQIEYDTYKSHKTVIRKMKEWKATWPFGDISTTFMKNFYTWHMAYLKKSAVKLGKEQKNDGYNTAQKTQAIIRSYLFLAAGDKIKFEMPNISVRYTETSRDFCNAEELKSLVEKYDTKFYAYDPACVDALEKFLFSCATGLRISDIKRLSVHDIENGCLNFIPFKGRKRQKEINIPIIGFIKQIIKGKTDLIFGDFAEQAVNRKLKLVASEAKINKNITMNVGRHTFATLFLQTGGDIKSLSDILGHSNMRTTQNYLHKDLDHIKRQMASGISNLFTPVKVKKTRVKKSAS